MEGRREIRAERVASQTLGSLRRTFAVTGAEVANLAARLATVDMLDSGTAGTLSMVAGQLAEIERRLGMVPEMVVLVEEAMALLTARYPDATKRAPSGPLPDARRPPAKPPRAHGVTPGFEFGEGRS